jgi:hypothetical protein
MFLAWCTSSTPLIHTLFLLCIHELYALNIIITAGTTATTNSTTFIIHLIIVVFRRTIFNYIVYAILNILNNVLELPHHIITSANKF